MFKFPSLRDLREFFKFLFTWPTDEYHKKGPWLLSADLERERKEMSRERFR